TNADGIGIRRRVGSNGTYVDIADLGPTMTSFADTAVIQGTTYYYRVRAYSITLGSSTDSNEANAPTPLRTAAPTALTATAVPGMQINLQWTDNSTNETGFKVERATTSVGTYVQITTLAAHTTSYSDTGLQAGTTYYYRVRAYSTTGNSGYS